MDEANLDVSIIGKNLTAQYGSIIVPDVLSIKACVLHNVYIYPGHALFRHGITLANCEKKCEAFKGFTGYMHKVLYIFTDF